MSRLTIRINATPLQQESEALRRAAVASARVREQVGQLVASRVPMTETVPAFPGSTMRYRQQLTDPYWSVLEASIVGEAA